MISCRVKRASRAAVPSAVGKKAKAVLLKLTRKKKVDESNRLVSVMDTSFPKKKSQNTSTAASLL